MPAGTAISYKDSILSFSIDREKGHLLSFNKGREFIVEDEKQSLFSLQFRNTTGEPLRVYSSQATAFDAQRVDEPGMTRFTLSYQKIAPHPDGFFERDINEPEPSRRGHQL